MSLTALPPLSLEQDYDVASLLSASLASERCKLLLIDMSLMKHLRMHSVFATWKRLSQFWADKPQWGPNAYHILIV